MIYSILLAAQMVAMPSSVTPDQLSTLAPAELGRRLLGSTRHPIVEAYLYGEALEPLLPVGAPTVTRLVLFEQARESAEAGFCEKIRYMVRLKPVVAGPGGTLPPSPADLVTPMTLYRWKTTDGSGPPCEGRGQSFLSISDDDARRVFSMIRLLASAQSDIRAHKRVRTKGSVDDDYARQGYPAAGETGPITDWTVALAKLPISKISSVRWEATKDGQIIRFRAEEWTVDMTLLSGGSAIDTIAFRRFIPAPA